MTAPWWTATILSVASALTAPALGQTLAPLQPLEPPESLAPSPLPSKQPESLASSPMPPPPSAQPQSSVPTPTATSTSALTPAPDLPLWEVGLFGGAASTPAYPGAADRSQRALVLPMVIYRGKVLRADRSGIGARLLNTDRVELDIGFALSLPARSDDVGARAGMPDLNSLLEFGPRLKVQLAETADARLRLELPLRVPLELGNGFKRQGLVFDPRLVAEMGDRAGLWQADANLGAVFGNARLNQYFYDVAPRYATADRPAYEAGGGLMMTRLGASLSRRVSPDWRVFGFTRYDNLSHAANRDSPLFRKNSGWSAGLGFTWTIHRSSSRAWE